MGEGILGYWFILYIALCPCWDSIVEGILGYCFILYIALCPCWDSIAEGILGYCFMLWQCCVERMHLIHSQQILYITLWSICLHETSASIPHTSIHFLTFWISSCHGFSQISNHIRFCFLGGEIVLFVCEVRQHLVTISFWSKTVFNVTFMRVSSFHWRPHFPGTQQYSDPHPVLPTGDELHAQSLSNRSGPIHLSHTSRMQIGIVTHDTSWAFTSVTMDWGLSRQLSAKST